MKVLIIEDEQFAQNELKRQLNSIDPAIEIMDCLESIEESIDWLESNDEPDLIFLDVQLSDGLSFEIFQQVEIKTPIIFTTAFDQYAVQAFKLNSIDYLMKPVERYELEQALDKYSELHGGSSKNEMTFDPEKIQKLLEINLGKEYKKRFIIKTGDRLRHVSVEDIAYFYSEDDYTYLVARENAKFIIGFKLDELVNLLDPNEFFRLSRKYISNVHSIKLVNKYFNSRLEVILEPPTKDQILISRVRVPEFMQWLER